jgi:hypothetical protein
MGEYFIGSSVTWLPKLVAVNLSLNKTLSFPAVMIKQKEIK